jgi:hypothetical protein
VGVVHLNSEQGEQEDQHYMILKQDKGMAQEAEELAEDKM